ncbi:MAG: pyridoxine 5'-phosphate synthase [Gammaproteobacteria bacterium]
MTRGDRIEITVVIDSVLSMREQQIWPYPDPLAFALAAERAGVDGILLGLRASHVSVQDRDWQMFRELQRARLCLAATPRPALLRRIAESSVTRCVLIPESRHQHSSGGALAVTVVRDELLAAGRLFESAGIELAARIDPDPVAVGHCVDAGLSAVEFNTSAFALAARAGGRARRLEELGEAVNTARAQGLRVSARGGLDYLNVTELIGCVDFSELRFGQAVISQALFDGIEASVVKMRDLLGD